MAERLPSLHAFIYCRHACKGEMSYEHFSLRGCLAVRLDKGESVSLKILNSATLYKLGHEVHYTQNKHDAAYAIYATVIEKFPNTPGAKYAASQIETLINSNPDLQPNYAEALPLTQAVLLPARRCPHQPCAAPSANSVSNGREEHLRYPRHKQ